MIKDLMQRELTPKEIVAELDKYIIGQDEAKKAVAVALRNRWRRQQIPEELRDEIAPKNIIMIGPTGVGKTEIARRLARLAHAPFLKVEATKYTEVGYVGRDVESMIRDLTDLAVNMVKKEESEKVKNKAKERAEERLLDLLLPSPSRKERREIRGTGTNNAKVVHDQPIPLPGPSESTREKFRKMLREGKLDNRIIEIEVEEKNIPMVEIFSGAGVEEMDINIKDMLGSFFPKRSKRQKVTVKEAREILTLDETQKLIDMDKVTEMARMKVEQSGIVFIDELDKVAGKPSEHGPDVSREGVQRDILPIVEGTTVNTKYGMVKTDHILFIAAGAFHISKPSDLIPELQGRFPIRVELSSLGREEFIRILKEPQNALIKQYIALMATEGVTIHFEDEAVEEIAETAVLINDRMENIGARRLHTIMEKLLEEISFNAPDLKGQKITITRDYVKERLSHFIKDEDLSRYIL